MRVYLFFCVYSSFCFFPVLLFSSVRASPRGLPHISPLRVRVYLPLSAFIDLRLMRCVLFFSAFQHLSPPPFALRPSAIGEEVSPSSPCLLRILPTPSCIRHCEMAYSGDGLPSSYIYTYARHTHTHIHTEADAQAVGRTSSRIVCLLASLSFRCAPPFADLFFRFFFYVLSPCFASTAHPPPAARFFCLCGYPSSSHSVHRSLSFSLSFTFLCAYSTAKMPVRRGRIHRFSLVRVCLRILVCPSLSLCACVGFFPFA